jgi:hypothetical protein
MVVKTVKPIVINRVIPQSSIYFDTETLSLNPYHANARIVLAQFGKEVNGVFTSRVFKEWELGEVNLIKCVCTEMMQSAKYTPIFTYNGMFDILYIAGRMNVLGFSDDDIGSFINVFTGIVKHCDMLQFDNGYFVSLDKICDHHNIYAECQYSGRDIYKLYMDAKFDDIVAHGIDDIKRLYKLVHETSLSDRFLNISVLGN